MRTAARVGLCAAALVGALATGAPARGSEAHATSTSPAPQLDAGVDIQAERETFATSLKAYRAGNDAALAPLVASAERMASVRRPDALDIVEFYRKLTPDERRAGFAAEARFESLRDAVFAAADLDSEAWSARRASIEAGLEALIAEQRDAPDPTPAARALALSALLEEQRARNLTALGPADVAALLVRVEARARDAIALFARAGLVTPTLEPVWLLARVEDARGNVGAARRGFEDCQDLAERVANEDYLVRALRGLILVADGVGDLEEQRGLLRELAAVREPKDDWWLARQWGALLIAEDEAEEALRFLAQNEPTRATESSQWHFLYGSALQRLGRIDEAESHFGKVVLAPSADATIACADVEARIWRAQSALERGDAAGALALAGPLTDTGCAAPARAQRAYTIGAAHLALGDAPRAEASLRAALEQGRALEARLARSDDGAVFGEVVGLETIALLADALMRQGRALEAVRVSEEIQTRALRSKADVAITEDDLRAWTATFERGLLTWIVGADTTVCAYVAPDGSAHAIAIPLGREILHDAVRRAREAAIAGDEPRARQLAKEIEARVVPEDLRRRIPSAGRLLVLAHGPLERMPFDLMGLAVNGPLAVLPGLASARPGTPPAASELAAWSILGDPSSAEGESVLPGARAEVETIARLVDASPKTGDAFDRLEVLDALRCGRSLHIATHLVRGVGEGGRDAGLLLARGALLTAREIREVAPRLPMAVLAACETANGRYVDAQALSSVSNAFLASGTRNLCVTLWPVEDGAARHWSESFHRALAAGARPSLAARHAQDELRRRGTPVSEWAAFRFVGRD